MCQFQHRAGEGGRLLLGQVVTRVGHLVVHAGPTEVTEIGINLRKARQIP
jgi:hypothetical protein